MVFYQGQHFPLQIPTRHGVVRLNAFKPRAVLFVRYRQSLHDLPRGHIAQSDVAHFARAHHVVEGGQHLFQGRDGVIAMELVQVDMVELEALQAGIELVHQVVARLPASIDLGLTHGAEGFGGNHQLIPGKAQVFDGSTCE